MNCKYCLAELEEDVSVCPYCGAQLTEAAEETTETAEMAEEIVAEEFVAETEEVCQETEEPDCQEQEAEDKKTLKVWKLIAAGLGVLVLLAAMAIAIFWPATGKTLLRTVGIRANDIAYKNSYTVEDQKAADRGQVVVATVDGKELTNDQLQVYYWMNVSDFLNYYGSYLSLMGVDYTKPFDEQVYDTSTGKTYQQMFLETALNNWHQYAVILNLAEREQFQMDAEQQEYVDGLATQLEELAASMGYTDLDKFLQEQLAPGTSADGYLAYMTDGFVASAYYNALCESMKPTAEEASEYYDAHEAEFVESGFGKENGKYYDVRHILVAIEGGTKDESGNVVYSDQDWIDCQNKAQALLDEFLAGEATEEIFASMAKEHSTDDGSSADGGLYTELTEATNFVDGFKNWYLDETRVPGDTGLVQSNYGYHIMYFSSSYDIWSYEAEDALLTERVDQKLAQAEAELPMEVDYKKIVLGNVDLSA